MSLNITGAANFLKKTLLLSIGLGIFVFPVSADEPLATDKPLVTDKPLATKEPANTEEMTGSGSSTSALSNDEDVYPAAFFDQYTPQNAMDMIDRLPGFSFNRGSNVRGFGGAAGNVLIDGSRPTSKSGGLRAVIRRIPAAQVDRIEILRGGISAGEAAGQSVVANIIRKEGGSSGTWKVITRRSPVSGKLYPHIRATLTSQLAAWDTTFDVNTGTEGNFRLARITETKANGDLVDVNDEDFITYDKWFVVSGEGSRSMAGGKFTLNSRVDIARFDQDTRRTGYVARLAEGHNDTFWRLDERTNRREIEIGLNWNRTYANSWRWNLIALMNLNRNEYRNESNDQNFLADTTSVDNYYQLRDKSEYIARTTYGLTSGTLKPEFGVEVARNQLDNQIENFEGGAIVVLDSANVLVKELRGEGFATLNYQATPKLSLESGLTFEMSRITVAGDANQEQNFKFLKPRLSATYSLTKNIQFTLEAERRIGQLDLNDFGASQDAVDNRDIAGNPNLQPEKRNRTAATFDWQFSERGSLRVKAFHHWRSDIHEQIILPSGGEGIGNAGDARFWGIQANVALPLDPVLKGGLLEVEYNYKRSRFEDPILNDGVRTISWYTPNWLNIEFRQDITDHKITWGFEYYGSFKDTGFLVSEFTTFEGNKRLRIFVETTRFFGVKARFTVGHANTGIYTKTRHFFDGDRGGAFTGRERAVRKRKPTLRLEISGTF